MSMLTLAPRQASGFTLIELLIVVVMLTVLLTIALPLYQDSVVRSNRAAAKGILQDVALRQEQYFINNKMYAEELEELGYDVDDGDAFYVDNKIERSDAEADDSVYKIEVVRLSSIEFSVSALPLNLQLKDDGCKAFTLTSRGQRSHTGSLTNDECW